MEKWSKKKPQFPPFPWKTSQRTGQTLPIQAKVSPISLIPAWSQLTSSSNDVYIAVGLCVALAILVAIGIGVRVYRKRNGINLHLCTERPINQSLEGPGVDVPLEQSADRDNHEIPEDNKADTSATLLLDADMS